MENVIQKQTAVDTAERKLAVIEELRKMPIVQIACQKAGVSRAAYYRWRKEDKGFVKKSDEAIEDGEKLINDMSESQLVSLIKERNWGAIVFWLRNHHPKYAQRIEASVTLQRPQEELTPEQEKVVREALRLASLADHEHDA